MLARNLQALGFVPFVDFVLQDDGRGAYIAQWLSGRDRPTMQEIDAATSTHLDYFRQRQQDQITRARDQALSALTVEVNGERFDADEASVQRMTGALMMWQNALAAQDPRAPATIAWLSSDNTEQILTIHDLGEIASAAWLAQQQVWGKNHAAKVAIEAASDLANINAVRF